MEDPKGRRTRLLGEGVVFMVESCVYCGFLKEYEEDLWCTKHDIRVYADEICKDYK